MAVNAHTDCCMSDDCNVGLAFHPIDGILQAVPYMLALFIVPMHYLTHLMLLFLTGNNFGIFSE